MAHAVLRDGRRCWRARAKRWRHCPGHVIPPACFHRRWSRSRPQVLSGVYVRRGRRGSAARDESRCLARTGQKSSGSILSPIRVARRTFGSRARARSARDDVRGLIALIRAIDGADEVLKLDGSTSRRRTPRRPARPEILRSRSRSAAGTSGRGPRETRDMTTRSAIAAARGGFDRRDDFGSHCGGPPIVPFSSHEQRQPIPAHRGRVGKSNRRESCGAIVSSRPVSHWPAATLPAYDPQRLAEQLAPPAPNQPCFCRCRERHRAVRGDRGASRSRRVAGHAVGDVVAGLQVRRL